MKVLIGCEFSGTVRDAFLSRGHDAWSCDILPTEKPGPHITGDVLQVLNEGWDLAIFHPPCTFLTCSAEWAYQDEIPHKKMKPGTLIGVARREARNEAVEFVRKLLAAPVGKICIENPIGVLSSRIRKPDQIIQPHQFGHDASKSTCLWLKGLQPLIATEHIAPRMVNGRPRWANQTDSGQNRLGPSQDRWAKRSETYSGIARAFAEQWG